MITISEHAAATLVERLGLEPERVRAIHLGIDRHQVVAALILQGVAGIVEQRGVGIRGKAGKLCHAEIHVALVGIDCLHHLEAERTKRRGDIFSIIFGIRESKARIIIIRIPHHERNAAVRPRTFGRARQQNAPEQCGQQKR